ncbi:MAG: type II toxin-antitoxin system Phd/YefM family antitoxin [Nitrosomonas sp. PRO5]|nr:type II toxin-antitoxin system Phd/YefM family antitoxin [Nitrosomonas sp. PRO5]
MKVYSLSEARQNFAAVLDNAQKEGAVRIMRRDGRIFIIQPVGWENLYYPVGGGDNSPSP